MEAIDEARVGPQPSQRIGPLAVLQDLVDEPRVDDVEGDRQVLLELARDEHPVDVPDVVDDIDEGRPVAAVVVVERDLDLRRGGPR